MTDDKTSLLDHELPGHLATSQAAVLLDSTPEQLVVSKLAGDASTRAYFRVRDHLSLPPDRTVIIALYGKPFDPSEPATNRLARMEAADPAARLAFANDPIAHIEVSDLFLSAGLPVPRILSVVGEEGAILIEDIGDTKLQDWLVGKTDTEITAQYRRALELVGAIQETTSIAIQTHCICSALAFDETKLRAELEFFLQNYFLRYLAESTFSPELLDLAREDFAELCRELSSLSRVLVHRDYHARNLMIHNDEMFIIDHQDARMGPETYDVVSLLSDPYTTLPPDLVAEMIEYFVELKMTSSLPLARPGAFQREYQLMAIQRILKAVGTYSFQSAVKQNPVYERYIEPAIAAALLLIGSTSRFSSIRQLLEHRR